MSKKCCNPNNYGSGSNPCTALTALLILCKSGLLNNDRAFILILLFWLCGSPFRKYC